MIQRDELQNYFLQKLQWEGMPDPAILEPDIGNDLQVPGSETIHKVGFSVSASIALFEKAVAEHCDAVVVHHGLRFPPADGSYQDPTHERRLEFLHKHKLSLFGFHMLLDAHPILGNSAQLLSTLKISPKGPAGTSGILSWGMMGDATQPMTLEKIVERLKPYSSPHTYVYPFGPEKILRVAVVTGSGAPRNDAVGEIVQHGIHCYITGSPRESTRELLREIKVHGIAAGHYHTETFGVKALMEQLQKDMNVETVFLDLPNEV